MTPTDSATFSAIFDGSVCVRKGCRIDPHIVIGLACHRDDGSNYATLTYACHRHAGRTLRIHAQGSDWHRVDDGLEPEETETIVRP